MRSIGPMCSSFPTRAAKRPACDHLRTQICQRFIKGDAYRFVPVPMPERGRNPADYRATVAVWHDEIAATYQRLLTAELPDGACGAFLVWGDPALYDSMIRIVDRIRANGLAIDYEVIPGISSVQALAAQHRIRLNRIGEPVLITTGRRLGTVLPADVGSVVVMLDGELSFTRIDQDPRYLLGRLSGLGGRDPDFRPAVRRPRRDRDATCGGAGAARLDHGLLPAAAARFLNERR